MNESDIANTINNKGYYILKNYISKDICQKIISNTKKCINFDKGGGNDLRQLFFEKYCNESKKFLHDKFLLEIGNNVLGHRADRKTKRCQLGILEYKGKGECSGGGWHIDNIEPQYKAILYLTYVCEKNGPFAILSPPESDMEDREGVIRKGKQIRFSDEAIEENFKDRIKILTGEPGDVIVVNTNYIHRGTVIQEGRRLTLTNYYYDC